MILICALMASAQQIATMSASDTPTITGSGAKDYVPLWLSSSKLGKSKVYQSAAGDVGVGTTTPAANLDVNGSVNASSSYNLDKEPFAFGSFSSQNAFLGFAGNSTTSGNQNTATGYGALSALTTGTENTVNGYQALTANTTGNFNTAIGYQTLGANTEGASNAAVGEISLVANISGNWNAALGNRSLFGNSSGNYNVGIGFYGGQTFDGSAGTGSGNTGVGAGSAFGTGSLSNATAIGNNALVDESNALVLGCIAGVNNCLGAVSVGIGTSTPSNILTLVKGGGDAIADGWSTYSSRRWKTNIETLQGALAKVEQLRGVSYDSKATGKHEVGVIAEEVGAVVPEVVSYEENGKDARSVDYSRLTALLIEAVKQQQAEIRRQQAKITQLTSHVKAIQASLRTNGQTGSEVRTVKVQVPIVQQ